jgi:hypothetical protein
MSIRTVQILGMGFGNSPAEVVITANENQVYSGTVFTINEPVWSLPNPELVADQVQLFTFEIDTSFSGSLPMTCEVINGTVIFGDITANYATILNPVFTIEQFEILSNPATPRATQTAIYTTVANPPFSAEELATLENPATSNSTYEQIINAHGCELTVSSGVEPGSIGGSDPRSNVYINGVQQVQNHQEFSGEWWWTVNQGSTLAYDLLVDPAKL